MILFMLIAAVLWGVTNPLLKFFSDGIKAKGSIRDDLAFLASKPKYLVTQLLNLCGSFFFFYGLRDVNVSIGSIVTNSLAFVITVIISTIFLKEESLNYCSKVGCIFVLLGTALCTFSSSS